MLPNFISDINDCSSLRVKKPETMNQFKEKPTESRRSLFSNCGNDKDLLKSKIVKEEPSNKRSQEFHNFQKGPPEVNPEEKKRVRRNLFGEDYDNEYKRHLLEQERKKLNRLKRMVDDKRRKLSHNFTFSSSTTASSSSATSSSAPSSSTSSSSASSSSRANKTYDDGVFLRPSEPKMKESWRKRMREKKKSLALKKQQYDDADFSSNLGYCNEYDGVFDKPSPSPWQPEVLDHLSHSV